MKKLLVLPLVLLCTGVFAQKFQFGLKAGANISSFTGLTWENVDNRAIVGFHGGAFLNLLLGDHFSLSPEALFSTQGARLKYADREVDYKLSYIAVPVTAKYRFNGGFYLEAGPQFSFKIDENTDQQEIDDFANNLDVGILGGLGYHSDGGFGIGGRYIWGVSKVGNFDSDALRNHDFRNGTIQISVFYTLFKNHRDKNP